MTTSLSHMLEAANAAVPRITFAQAKTMMAAADTLTIDVRDAPELAQTGRIPGAIAISRGMLEFRADPASPYYDPSFNKDKTIILYCASGGRSALAGKTLRDLGYAAVFNLGGIKDWVSNGGAIER